MQFISKFKKYKIWLKPSRYVTDGLGQRNFVAGIKCQFSDGRYETNDKEEITLLKANPRYGLDFHSLEQDKNEGLSEAALQQKQMDEEALDTVTHSCPKCSFKAQNRLGLMSHMRAKHKDSAAE